MRKFRMVLGFGLFRHIHSIMDEGVLKEADITTKIMLKIVCTYSCAQHTNINYGQG